ncbi:hypothetical protein PYV00_10380 [Novosphingobium sp. H3SJ31-1]|uniref:Uncharacterized protein n=1 Tax=Novosphingobium album (ex Liu et al. 2023) TaxID=3031130 RepID=A0ABT5WQU4_9SPHN|nr:hypothetical protein [Novosphingobium album (ex Liu et al. 2023)]MDE8652121.1 hypothetical protein [Novosphingobium album (ex Liu et al. 2023)]
MGVPDHFEQRDAIIDQIALGVGQSCKLLNAAMLLLAPLLCQTIMEFGRDLAVHLVDVERIQPASEPIGFGAELADAIVALILGVGCGLLQGPANERESLVVQIEPAENLLEFLVENLLANIALGTPRLEPGAVVIDIALLLDFRRDRAAAMAAGHDAGIGELVLVTVDVGDAPPVEQFLNVGPGLERHQRLMRPLIDLALPLERAGVDPVAEDLVDGAGRQWTPAFPVSQPGHLRLLRRLLDRILPALIPGVEARDQRPELRVDGDDLLTVLADNVGVAKRRGGRPDALLGLFHQALPGFFRQVIDVVLRHQHLDAMHELLG